MRITGSLVVSAGLVWACGGWFHEPPPLLRDYVRRFPGKTMTEMLRETLPRPENAADADAVAKGVLAFIDHVPTTGKDELIKELDGLLLLNREGDYRKRFANFLIETKELLDHLPAAPEQRAVVTDYLQERYNLCAADDGFFRHPPSRDYAMTEAQHGEVLAAWQKSAKETVDALEARADGAPDFLRPHWLVQAANAAFMRREWARAKALFERVVADHGSTPRAEVAQLMLARVALADWQDTLRNGWQMDPRPQEQDIARLSDAAGAALDAYVEKYPQGRFIDDIPGWKAGRLWKSGGYADALVMLAEQLDVKGHPEIVRRAGQEMERCLLALAADDRLPERLQDFGWGQAMPKLARHPDAALRLVYFLLDPASRKDFERVMYHYETVTDREVQNDLRQVTLAPREAARDLLPALAAAVLEGSDDPDRKWRAREKTVLAWAVSESGEHGQALRLLGQESDDHALLARAVIAERAGDLETAAEALRQLGTRYANSPLAVQWRVRLGTVLRDQGKFAEALVEYWEADRGHELYDGKDAPREEAPPLHLKSEVTQWIDTLVLFAPTKQLEALQIEERELPGELRLRVRGELRTRCLAADDFVSALRFLGENDVIHVSDDWRNPATRPLDADELRTWCLEMAKLKKQAEAGTTPMTRFHLAEKWAQQNGRIFWPMELDDLSSQGTRRLFRERQNARLLGMKDAESDAVIDSRQELTHAIGNWQAAATDEALSKPQRLDSLLRANDALHRRAEFTALCFLRAGERDDGALSQRLYAQAKALAGPEAERLDSLVWWTFPSPEAGVRWLPRSGHSGYLNEIPILLGMHPAGWEKEIADGTDQWQLMHSAWEDRGRLRLIREALERIGGENVEALSASVQKLREESIPTYRMPAQSALMNALEDAALFLEQSQVTPAGRIQYLRLRFADDTEWKPVDAIPGAEDFVRFMNLTRAPLGTAMCEEEKTWQAAMPPPADATQRNGDAGTWRYRYFRSQVARMKAFLAEFPQSPKREAAMARLAIYRVRMHRVRCRLEAVTYPASPGIRCDYVKFAIQRVVPLDEKGMVASLDAYDKEFPQGRYAADVRLWRGVALIDAGKIAEGLRLLAATINDAKHRDLHLDASLALGEVFDRLLDEQQRGGVVQALKQTPTAAAVLRRYMHSDSAGARLALLKGWLEAQL